MTILTRLSVTNDMLSNLGEAPVNALDVQHPLIASCLAKLDAANSREQGTGWWFNTERLTLTPTVEDKSVFLPTDTLSVDAIDPELSVAQRGRRLYKLDSQTAPPYEFTSPVEVELIRLIPFEDLPPVAQVLVSAQAKLDFHMAQDGDVTKLQLLRDDEKDARINLNAAHTRARQANIVKARVSRSQFVGGNRLPRRPW